jgi:hypothetical protein
MGARSVGADSTEARIRMELADSAGDFCVAELTDAVKLATWFRQA